MMMRIAGGFLASALVMGLGCAATTETGAADTATSGSDVTATDTSGGADLPKDAAGDVPIVPPLDVPADLGGDSPPPLDEGPKHDTPTNDVPAPLDEGQDTSLDLGADQSQPLDAGPATDKPMFRITTISLLTPTLSLCVPGSDCLPVNAAVDSILAENLNDPTAPLDVLTQFASPVPEAGTTSVTLGQGTCLRDTQKVIQSCAFGNDPQAPPVLFDSVALKLSAACYANPTVPAPCFVTTPKDGLVLTVGDVKIGLKEALAAGTILSTDSEKILKDGFIKGFLPKAYAATIGFDLGGKTVSLADLLAKVTLETSGGVEGWSMTFAFGATAVPAAK